MVDPNQTQHTELEFEDYSIKRQLIRAQAVGSIAAADLAAEEMQKLVTENPQMTYRYELGTQHDIIHSI